MSNLHRVWEIVLGIQSRLPVTPILQFKLVCKAWLNTAQIPVLASMHFANTGKDDPCLILNCENPSRQQLYSSELSSREEENQKAPKSRFVTTNLVRSRSVTNDLPGYDQGLLKAAQTPDLDFNIQHVVFGFDLHPTSNEYKPSLEKFRESTLLFDPGAITSFSRRKTSLVSLVYLATWFMPLACLLLTSKMNNSGRSRDLKGKDYSGCNFDLVNLRGCFAVGVPCNNGTYDIWVTKDYEVKESWIKEYSIEIQYGYKSPVSYNPRNGTFKDLLFLRKPNRFEEYVHQGTLSRIKNLTDT
ncbi:hypothetical protein WN944_011060 [Citrus x changshan-huyou]|uniref:Uncharacterized protein n=1 Tax=Citrus x changshan-huyou TaxID=2935761 RepID=A0AAP0MUU8_9ROSI